MAEKQYPGAGSAGQDAAWEATVQAASITTNNEMRDGHLKTADFLDIEKNPTLTLKSTQITSKGGDDYKMVADLTVRGSSLSRWWMRGSIETARDCGRVNLSRPCGRCEHHLLSQYVTDGFRTHRFQQSHRHRSDALRDASVDLPAPPGATDSGNHRARCELEACQALGLRRCLHAGARHWGDMARLRKNVVPVGARTPGVRRLDAQDE